MQEKNAGNHTKPLFGKRIMITRAKSQSTEFVEMIESLGGEAYEFPVIQIGPPSDWGPVDAAIEDLASYQWVIFTSANGVDFFFRRVREIQDLPAGACKRVSEDRGGSMGSIGNAGNIRGKIAAVGTKTADALRKHRVSVDLLPQEFVGESLVEELRSHVQKGQRVLLPRADIARKLLPDALREIGCEVTEIDVYENHSVNENREDAIRLLQKGEIHVITFTSSSTVRSFVTIMKGEDLRRLLSGVIIACIGPVTAETAVQLELLVDVTAEPYTVQGLMQALVKYIKE